MMPLSTNASAKPWKTAANAFCFCLYFSSNFALQAALVPFLHPRLPNARLRARRMLQNLQDRSHVLPLCWLTPQRGCGVSSLTPSERDANMSINDLIFGRPLATEEEKAERNASLFIDMPRS